MIKLILIFGVLSMLATTNALAFQADVNWLQKYPKPSPVTLYPWWPLEVAENFVACAPPASIPDDLRQVLVKMSVAHYLDDFSDTVKIFESFSDSGNEIAKFFLAIVLSDGTAGAIDDITANNLIKEVESSDNPFILAHLLTTKLQLAGRLNLEDETLTTDIYLRLTDALEENPENTFIAQELGGLYAFDENIATDDNRAFELLE